MTKRPGEKIALITGSSRGIGKAIAYALASKGIKIILHSSKKTQLSQINYLNFKKKFPKTLIYYADISDYKKVKEMTKFLKKTVKKIDILINNAGVTRDRTFAKMDPYEWQDVININLNGLFNVTHNLLSIIPSGSRIINISSIIALTGAFGQSNYAASKAGIIGFSKSLSLELAKRKITVNTVCPGFTKTDMVKKIPGQILNERIISKIPLKRLANPEEIANLVCYLCSDDAAYITGSTLIIDGGLSLGY